MFTKTKTLALAAAATFALGVGAQAADLRRQLEKRYVELRGAGQALTREALLEGQSLPPYLRLELLPDGVRVAVVPE